MLSLSTSASEPISKASFAYASCYCEENIYLLAAQLSSTNPTASYYVLFISSIGKCAPVWHQLAATSPSGKGDDGSSDQPCIWDYHVVLLEIDSTLKISRIYDFDSTLEFPCRAVDYVVQAIRPHLNLKDEFEQ